MLALFVLELAKIAEERRKLVIAVADGAAAGFCQTCDTRVGVIELLQ